MEKSEFFVSAVIFPLILLFYVLRKKKTQPKHGAELPPGSMGWPYIGETLQLYSQDPNVFFAAKQKRSDQEIYKYCVFNYLPFVFMLLHEFLKCVFGI